MGQRGALGIASAIVPALSEFLWQEGHTAHASFDDASAYATMIHATVYNDFFEKVMAMPTYRGIKPASERFAGAINSMTAEGVMRDGKALQMATTHELGQNFARAFDIYFQSEAGQAAACYTTSWGASTRLVGGLIMAHGDDNGLMLPPRSRRRKSSSLRCATSPRSTRPASECARTAKTPGCA